MRLSTKAFSLTSGVMWSLGLFLLTWWIILFEGATKEKTIIGQIYRGYNISPKGSFLGLLWGAVDGFMGGMVFSLVYNFFVKKVKRTEVPVKKCKWFLR